MQLSVDITQILGDLTLKARFTADSGVTAFYGPSGTGKTSLLRAIAGLSRPDAGEIRFGDETLFDTGTEVSPNARRFGYVFQEARLFPHLDVRRNLTFGPDLIGQTAPDFDRIVDLLGIAPLLQRKPRALSGGEAQRVAIGRALLSKPRLLLMDEPLSSLDSARRDDILPYLERLKSEGLPILYVSHQMAEVARLADHILLMDHGQITHAGPVDAILSDPTLTRQIGLRQTGAILRARVCDQPGNGLTGIAFSGGRLWLPTLDADLGAPVRLRILAQDVMISAQEPVGLSAQNVLPMVVTQIYRGTGPAVVVQMRSGTDHLLSRITLNSADRLGLVPGKKVWAVIKSLAIAPSDVGWVRNVANI